MNSKINLFLDSGAFSAKSKKAKINVQDYIACIKEFQDVIEIYANLDVIGDPEATLVNQKIMEEAGLSPIPCYHYMEDLKYLNYYLERYDYIALGGIAQLKGDTQLIMSWMDTCFNVICNQSSRLPKVKVHGFAVTSVVLMHRYPWFSVDSTSWIASSRNGVVPIPRLRNGVYRYDLDPFKIAVSQRSPTKTQGQWRHITCYPEGDQKKFLDYFTLKGYQLGKSEFRIEPESYKPQENERFISKSNDEGQRDLEIIVEPGLCNNYFQRDELNIIYYLDVEKSMPEWPWPFELERKGFFD